MTTTMTRPTRRTRTTPTHMPLPPPTATTTRQEFRDLDAVVGWLDRDAIGLRGFGSADEAAHAAWVAHRTMARHFARQTGRRVIPVDTEPLSLAWSGDVELILAGGRPIAALTRPGDDSPSGPDSFGFELQLPVPSDELTVRATAHLVYRTLRRSGLRWAMWTPAPVPGARSGSLESPAARAARRTPAGMVPRSDGAPTILASLLVVLIMVAIIVLPAMTMSLAVGLLGAAAAVVAGFALASLVRLVVTDVRATREAGDRPTDHGDRPTYWSRLLALLSRDHPRQAYAARRMLRGSTA